MFGVTRRWNHLFTFVYIYLYTYLYVHSLTKRSLKRFLLYVKGDWKDIARIGSPRLLSGHSPLAPPDSELYYGSPDKSISISFEFRV